MSIILDREIIRKEKFYRMGYLPSIDRYVLADMVTWVAWYERLFFITEEEYNSDFEVTDKIDEYCRKSCANERFFLSENKRDVPPDVWERQNKCQIHMYNTIEEQGIGINEYYKCYNELFYPKYIAPATSK